ncbi:SLC13A2_3_5 [Mytilus edulis]|uniref:SLC13A2_3_5 n=1 Tax=Mytilus edulis TaxID=6550 RepID=A0A8S3PSG3_MYTED|nr:SLC13A2_3_5 [Mytilus edulis]
MSRLQNELSGNDDYKFQRKSCEDQFKFNRKLSVTLKEADASLESRDPSASLAKQKIAEGPIPPLLTWKIVEKKLPWGVVILLGGGFALAFVSQEYGLSKWLGTQLAVLKPLDPWIVNMILCIIVAAATEVTSNVAMCTLLMPILAELSLQLEVNPLYFMFPAAIATSFAFMLPVATPPNAVVFAYGYLEVIDMVRI